MYEPETRLSATMAPAFASVHRDIKAHGHVHYWLKGGRGSTKSSFAAIQTVLALLRDERVNAVVMRKVGNTMRDSVYAQIQWAIDVLGVAGYFRSTVSPMEIVYRPTGQRILFRGADDAGKLKSIKTVTGYVGFVWFEELDQFHGPFEVRTILQSLMRGGDHFTVLYSFNPPKSRDSWANKEAMVGRDDRLVHTSTYHDVPRAWLGETFFGEADELARTNEAAYRHEYLGEVIGTGGNVFENLVVAPIPDVSTDEAMGVDAFDRVHNGVDFGYFPDPWVFERVHYDAARRRLYVFAEASEAKASNATTAELIKGLLQGRELVTCDSAEPKSIADYRDLGLDARPAFKGPGSVDHSMRWLQSLDAIVIDPVRCPLAAAEFTAYEYERTRDGDYCSGYPDANNHAIDAVRYAMSPTIQRRHSA